MQFASHRVLLSVSGALPAGIEKTPWEVFSGKVPDLAHLRVFRAEAFVLSPKGCRRALYLKGLEGVLMRYSGSEAYRIVLNESKLVISGDVMSCPYPHLLLWMKLMMLFTRTVTVMLVVMGFLIHLSIFPAIAVTVMVREIEMHHHHCHCCLWAA
jgi:hypothetical protein